MNGYVYSGTYAHDFGCKYTQYFYTNTPISGVITVDANTLSMDAYPNPATDKVYIDIAGITNVSGTINVIDAVGRVVKTIDCTNSHVEIETSDLQSGIYTLLFVNQNGNKLQSRMLITK
jgi:hypothetical protein